uniref:Gap junction protein n=1 Tax=Gouania willdenowi TaxID=441366 RepID=A0A8C5G862_GOUWI
MTEWILLKRLLDAVHQHSTLIGRLWLTVMVIFRLLIVAVATEDVYTDEQEMFVCNTLQPGCSTVCYDAFAPISQPRFWVFHIISVSTPSLCFIIYTWHKLSKTEEKLPDVHSCDSDSCSIHSHKHLGHVPTTRVLSKCYVVHVCLRALLELVFLLAQWKLFGFQVPVHVLCRSSPCSQPVDCYVSRPTEKTIFLRFMFCVGMFCILLNVLELNHLGWKKIRQVLRSRDATCWRGCPGYGALFTGASSLPTLDLVVGHQPDWTCPLTETENIYLTSLEKPKEQRSKKEENNRTSNHRSVEVWI